MIPRGNRTGRVAVAIVVVFVGLAVTTAGSAQPQPTKLTPADAEAYDYFGGSVSIRGDSAIIGSSGDGVSGSAYVYQRDGATWTQQAKLDSPGYGGSFGNSVSLHGDTAVIGDFADSYLGQYTGAAYIFQRNGASWTLQTKLIAMDASGEDAFGSCVSVWGDYAFVTAPGHDNYQGATYIFRRDGETWTQHAMLDGYGDSGSSVSVWGDYAIVGNYRDYGSSSYSGAAYIYHLEGTTWTQQAKLAPSDGAQDDYFGLSVSLCDEYAIVGSYWDDDAGEKSGSSYIFHRDGTTWTQQAKLTADDAAAGDCFGRSVSISDDRAIVGAYMDDAECGSAYVFLRDGTTWTQQVKLTGTDTQAGDQFGASVSLSGEAVVVGASYHDGVGARSGSVYVFDTIPEPTSVLLFATCGLALPRRRRVPVENPSCRGRSR
ncbi:MAG: hypothetical protein JXA11_03290 [Phycisphaerae bacterium]|nr:hypothetical protein [Phycisphaerae bacterium]